MILTRFLILTLSFLFLTSSHIVSAFGYDCWYDYRDYPPTPRISVPEPEPIEINLHRKISITPGMCGVIIKLTYFKDGDFVGKNTLLFIVEAMKMEVSVCAPFSGYIMLTENYKKILSCHDPYSYVESNDPFFMFSEDEEIDTQDSSFYNDKNDDDNNKCPPSLQEEPILTNTGGISLLAQPLERAPAHHLEYSSSEQMSNLEKTAQTSSSENTPLSSPSEKITSKTLETSQDVLRFNNQKILNYGVLFFQSPFSFSFKNILNLGPNCPLNFSKIKSFRNSREEQTNVLSLFKLQYILSQPNVKHAQLRESLFLKKDFHREQVLFFIPPKGSSFQKIDFFQDPPFHQKKEILLWNLMALYGVLSLVFFFRTRRMSPELFMIYLSEKMSFFVHSSSVHNFKHPIVKENKP
ncbi:MAG TPA: hypothetical protein PLY23_09220 [Alphaproteobacteria bacterium]|nr:hypothetical protein [Alphaproteobacteria bacterium]HQS94785.1 hypothetical protein [Alphaproteobacteria bacterium]